MGDTSILFSASLRMGEAFVPLVISRIQTIARKTKKMIKTTIAYGDNPGYLRDPLFYYQSDSPCTHISQLSHG